MDLKNLEGTIIGVVTREYQKEDYSEKLVSDIITHRPLDSLKMVGLEPDTLKEKFDSLSTRDQNKVILASKLNDKEIVLYDFSKGLLKKDLDYFKRLFKKIASYNKKIILVSVDAELFLNCVDKLYIIHDGEVQYESDTLFDPTLYLEMDSPEIINFIYKCLDMGVHLDEYTDINELIKAIYRIKS